MIERKRRRFSFHMLLERNLIALNMCLIIDELKCSLSICLKPDKFSFIKNTDTYWTLSRKQYKAQNNFWDLLDIYKSRHEKHISHWKPVKILHAVLVLWWETMFNDVVTCTHTYDFVTRNAISILIYRKIVINKRLQLLTWWGFPF